MAEDLLRDDRTWDRVWERVLGPVERHSIAVSVLRRRTPPDPFEQRIAAELARRWARHALVLALGYAAWTLFWGALAWELVQRSSPVATLPVACALVGFAAVVGCVLFRRWVSAADGHPRRRGGSP